MEYYPVAGSLNLLDITRKELNGLKHDCSSEIESITNSTIDDIGISDYLQIRNDVDTEVCKYKQSLIRRERSKLLKFNKNSSTTDHRESSYNVSSNNPDHTIFFTPPTHTRSMPSCSTPTVDDSHQTTDSFDSVYFTPPSTPDSDITSRKDITSYSIPDLWESTDVSSLVSHLPCISSSSPNFNDSSVIDNHFVPAYAQPISTVSPVIQSDRSLQ